MSSAVSRVESSSAVANEPRQRRAQSGWHRRDEEGDLALVKRAQAGDRWAEEALFRRHIAQVVQLATRLVGNESIADDVTQETFFLALRDLKQLRDPGAFRPWLFRIAVNQAKRAVRRRKWARLVAWENDVDDAGLYQLAAPGATPDQLAELRRLTVVLQRVSTDHRIAWMLRYVQGETLTEVARLTGCSLATAKRHIRAAQRRLEKYAVGGDE